jgi:hypothetical protein
MNSNLYTIARVSAFNLECLEVYMTPDRKIVIREFGRRSQFLAAEERSWADMDHDILHEKNDGNIIEMVAEFLGCLPHQLCANQIIFHDAEGSSNVDERLKLDIYEYTWSNIVRDKQVLHFNVQIFGWMTDKYERLATAIEDDKWVPGYIHDQEAIARMAADLRLSPSVPLRIRTPPYSDFEPQSPTCGYCSGEGRLYIAVDENIRCRDCFGLAVDTHYMVYADNEVGYCAC